MTTFEAAKLVAGREIRVKLRDKAFLFGTVLLLFFICPLVFIVGVSFCQYDNSAVVPAFTWANYADVFGTGLTYRLYLSMLEFAAITWVATLVKSDDGASPASLAHAINAVTAELGTDIGKLASDPEHAAERLSAVKDALLQLCATYLIASGDTGVPASDPVARFHLNNGARLERINWLADVSRKGLRESLGLMVNYLYEPRSIEDNHEKFIRGELPR